MGWKRNTEEGLREVDSLRAPLRGKSSRVRKDVVNKDGHRLGPAATRNG